ncbi:MAG: ComEC/Rec2 family competence protein, partial [Gemmatimonadales bacterium]
MKPRPSILFTAAYGAGLATGLLHFGGLFGAVLIAGVPALSGRPLPVLLAAAGLLGRLSGEVARAAEQDRCAARLPEGGRLGLSVRLVEPVDPRGGRIMVEPLGAGCAGAVAARWPARVPLAAGRVARVRADWVARSGFGGRPGGMLVVTEVGELSGRPSIPARVRSRIVATSHLLYGARAPMVDALILGRRGGMDPDLQERFAQSGLVHLLSISGFHVGLITAWVFLLARLLRVGRSRALVLAATVSVAYVLFLGWPAPAARAAALAAILARCQA